MEDGKGIKCKFKNYLIGYFYIDIVEVCIVEGWFYFFVVIDCILKFVYIELYEKVIRCVVVEFL